MRTYHPDSWSKQARRLSDRIIENVKYGDWTYEEGARFFNTSYRHSLIRGRAAKRYGRWRRAMMRCGQVVKSTGP